MSLGTHLRTRLADGRAIVKSIEERRLVARLLLELGRDAGLITFAVPLHHVHVESILAEAEAKRFLRDVEAALRRRLRLPVPFRQYEPEPIRDQRHLRNTFDYVLRQADRHGVRPLDPRCECSSLPDLLGLRPLGRYTLENAERLLGPLDEGRLLDLIGAPGLLRMEPVPWCETWLVEAAAAAACLPHLGGRSPAALAARRAALEVGLLEGLPPQRLGELLGLPMRTLRWLRHRPVDRGLVQAIFGQLRLMNALTAASPAERAGGGGTTR